MIDSCLERLHAARRLLSTHARSSVVEDLLQATEARIAKTKKKVRPQISTKKKRRDELTTSLFAPTPELEAATPEPTPNVEVVQDAPAQEAIAKQPDVVAAPRPRLVARATPTPRRKPAPQISALVGHVPSGPVFIPAAQMREKEAQKQAASLAERTSSREAESTPLTAELLAQRWIQSAGF